MVIKTYIMKITIEQELDNLSAMIELDGKIVGWEQLTEIQQRVFLNSLATIHNLFLKET